MSPSCEQKQQVSEPWIVCITPFNGDRHTVTIIDDNFTCYLIFCAYLFANKVIGT